MLAENFSTKLNFLSKKPFKIYDETYDFRKKSKSGQGNRGKVREFYYRKSLVSLTSHQQFFIKTSDPRVKYLF